MFLLGTQFNQLSHEVIIMIWKSITIFLHAIKLRKIGNSDVQRFVGVFLLSVLVNIFYTSRMMCASTVKSHWP